MSKKILIIEDEEILANLLRDKFKELGYEAHIAEDGIHGLEAIEEIVPNLIILDVVMPRMGGFELMERMQENESIKNIPVIIVSNSGQPVEIDKAKQLGAKDWLIKTEFDPREVIEKVIAQIGGAVE